MSAHSWVIPPGWGKLCDMVVLVTKVDVPFIILIMSAHSWVIPPGWGKLCDMVSLLRRQMYHSLSLLSAQKAWSYFLVSLTRNNWGGGQT